MKPTVGRKIWYVPGKNDEGTMAITPDGVLDATVVCVHSEKMINVAIFDANGVQHARHSIEIVDEGDAIPDGPGYCKWMPYQIGQAAKTEQLQEKLGEA